MLLLATGAPSANHTDDRIIITVPNGDTPVSISFTLNEALVLAEMTKRAAVRALDEHHEQARANLITFPSKRRVG
jgi:hypothetical protein